MMKTNKRLYVKYLDRLRRSIEVAEICPCVSSYTEDTKAKGVNGACSMYDVNRGQVRNMAEFSSYSSLYHYSILSYIHKQSPYYTKYRIILVYKINHDFKEWMTNLVKQKESF